MKRQIIPILLIVLALVLGACGASPDANPGESGAPAGAPLLSAGYEDAAPVLTQLVIGTIKLEGTDTAVDAAMAAELLPLWKAAQSLSKSDATAPQEMEALLKQIQETMSPDQIEVIAAMQIAEDDVRLTMQEYGASLKAQGGDGKDGDAAGGGREGPGGGKFAPEQKETAQAMRKQSGFDPSLMLIPVVIELLEGKGQ